MKSLKQIIYSWVEKYFLGGCSNYNSLTTRKSCRSKKQAREMFSQNKIPYAKGEIFYGPVKPFRFVKKYGFPVVVKPNVSGFSRGSHFPINSYYDLLKAIILVKIWWPSSVIEQYLEGKNYRVVVVKDEIMSIIRRYPPFVIGDGYSTIGELIDRENKIRHQMKLDPVIHLIQKSYTVSRFLKKKKLSFSSIPLKDKMVTLYNRISLAPGGIIETLDNENMHEVNKGLFPFYIPVYLYKIGFSLAQICCFIAITGLGFCITLYLWDRISKQVSFHYLIVFSFLSEVILLTLFFLEKDMVFILRSVTGYKDQFKSTVVFAVDGVFLYLESYFWVISLFLIVRQSYWKLGVLVILLMILFGAVFVFVKNGIDRLPGNKMYTTAVCLYSFSWILRGMLSEKLNIVLLLFLLAIITFCTSIFRLTFNKRFFDIAKSRTAHEYIL